MASNFFDTAKSVKSGAEALLDRIKADRESLSALLASAKAAENRLIEKEQREQREQAEREKAERLKRFLESGESNAYVADEADQVSEATAQAAPEPPAEPAPQAEAPAPAEPVAAPQEQPAPQVEAPAAPAQKPAAPVQKPAQLVHSKAVLESIHHTESYFFASHLSHSSRKERSTSFSISNCLILSASDLGVSLLGLPRFRVVRPS